MVLQCCIEHLEFLRPESLLNCVDCPLMGVCGGMGYMAVSGYYGNKMGYHPSNDRLAERALSEVIPGSGMASPQLGSTGGRGAVHLAAPFIC